MIRIGVDVGGTNTDAVVMDGQRVLAWSKTTTTPDATNGLVAAAREALARSGVTPAAVRVDGRHAVLRVGLDLEPEFALVEAQAVLSEEVSPT